MPKWEWVGRNKIFKTRAPCRSTSIGKCPGSALPWMHLGLQIGPSRRAACRRGCRTRAPAAAMSAFSEARNREKVSRKSIEKKSGVTQGTAVWPRLISRATMLWGEIMSDIPKTEPWPKNDRRRQSEWRMRTIRCKEASLKSVCRELSRVALAGKAAEASFPKGGYQFSDKMMRDKGIQGPHTNHVRPATFARLA